VFRQSELDVNLLRCFRYWSRPIYSHLGTEANLAAIGFGAAELKLAAGEIGLLVVDAHDSGSLRRDVTADAKIVSLLTSIPRVTNAPDT
jgi:hypothetical protein